MVAPKIRGLGHILWNLGFLGKNDKKLEGAPLDVFRQFQWYQVICINGPEGFLPKKQNFMMQVVQVLWYRPFSFQIFFVPRTGSAADLLNIQISGVFASAGWPSGYLSSPNIRYNLPFLPSRHLTLNLKPKLLGIVSQWWLLQAVSVGTKKVVTMAWNMNWPIGVFTIHWSPLVKSWTLDSRHLFLTIFVLESWGGVGHPDTT